jgi:hypothetical protein
VKTVNVPGIDVKRTTKAVTRGRRIWILPPSLTGFGAPISDPAFLNGSLYMPGRRPALQYQDALTPGNVLKYNILTELNC